MAINFPPPHSNFSPPKHKKKAITRSPSIDLLASALLLEVYMFKTKEGGRGTLDASSCFKTTIRSVKWFKMTSPYSCGIHNQHIFLVQARHNFISTTCLLGACVVFFATKLQQLLTTCRKAVHGLREMEQFPIGTCQAEQLTDITAPITVLLAARIYSRLYSTLWTRTNKSH